MKDKEEGGLYDGKLMKRGCAEGRACVESFLSLWMKWVDLWGGCLLVLFRSVVHAKLRSQLRQCSSSGFGAWGSGGG